MEFRNYLQRACSIPRGGNLIGEELRIKNAYVMKFTKKYFNRVHDNPELIYTPNVTGIFLLSFMSFSYYKIKIITEVFLYFYKYIPIGKIVLSVQ